MPTLLGRVSVPRRSGLALLAACVAVFASSWHASPANAGIFFVSPSVKGFGAISGAVGCGNGSQNPAVIVTCGTQVAGNGNPTTPEIVSVFAVPSGHWTFARWENCPNPSGPTCVLAGFSGSFAPRAVFQDTIGPSITAANAELSTTVDRGVKFTGIAANEALLVAFCSVGGRAAKPCHETHAYPEGTHTVIVQGRDLSGNSGPMSAVLDTFQIVDTKLLSGPADFSAVRRPTFRYSTIAGITFECSLDGSPFVACPAGNSFTPPSNLPDGAHTFRVRAVDGPDFDRVPVTRTWTVDTVRPNTTVDPLIGPRDGEVSTLLTAAFSIVSSEPGTLQCRLDAAPFAPCSSSKSFAGLGFGQHRFEARAIDRAGNVDLSPISRTWTVLAVDNDGDGFNQRSDCNDADPLIRPAAREIAGNSVDENCDGFVAPRKPVTSPIPNGWSVAGRNATLTKLQVKRLPSGAKVEVRCLGKKCKFKRVKANGKPKRGVLNVLKSLKPKQRRFRAGQTLEVRVTAPRMIGKVVRYKMRAGKLPKAQELCLPPGARQPRRCT